MYSHLLSGNTASFPLGNFTSTCGLCGTVNCSILSLLQTHLEWAYKPGRPVWVYFSLSEQLLAQEQACDQSQTNQILSPDFTKLVAETACACFWLTRCKYISTAIFLTMWKGPLWGRRGQDECKQHLDRYRESVLEHSFSKSLHPGKKSTLGLPRYISSYVLFLLSLDVAVLTRVFVSWNKRVLMNTVIKKCNYNEEMN